jgi:hypothetical protein
VALARRPAEAASAPRRSLAVLRPVSRTRAAEPFDRAGSPPGAAANGAAGRSLARAFYPRRSPTTTTGTGTGTSATRLAAQSGGSLVAAPDGRASVVFSSAGRQAAGPVHAATTQTVPTTPTPLPAPAPAAPPAIDVDDLYDQIAKRLRRELLLDRERGGELP